MIKKYDVDTFHAYIEDTGTDHYDEPMAGDCPESRFFIEHQTIHDRKTGQHVAMTAEAEWQRRLFILLCELESAHAEWEAKEKALRELADRWMDEMESMTTPMRHQSLICSEHASDLLVILNREQEKQP